LKDRHLKDRHYDRCCQNDFRSARNRLGRGGWLQDIPGNLEKANSNRPPIADKAPADLK
tara:strand:+ start:281 stop:457 length:177 start_codon:yes stop_codon:yes gene_type:complete